MPIAAGGVIDRSVGHSAFPQITNTWYINHAMTLSGI